MAATAAAGAESVTTGFLGELEPGRKRGLFYVVVGEIMAPALHEVAGEGAAKIVVEPVVIGQVGESRVQESDERPK